MGKKSSILRKLKCPAQRDAFRLSAKEPKNQQKMVANIVYKPWQTSLGISAYVVHHLQTVETNFTMLKASYNYYCNFSYNLKTFNLSTNFD